MIPRRCFLTGSAALAPILVRSVRAAPDDGGAVLHAADTFAASVGVNVHVGSEPYASRFDTFRSLIGMSGIRHLRDELRPGNDLARWKGLHREFGIRGHWLVSPATNTVPQMMEYLAAIGPETVSAVEGQNEGDSPWFMAQPQAQPDWAAAVVAYQRAVHLALRARYPKERLPILSPSVLDWKPADVALIRDAASYCDAVAVHSYVQRAQEPETEEDYAALSWYLRHFRDAFKPGAPVMATETGYCTATPRPGGTMVSERAAARYIPRLLLHNFAAGVPRTFLYEFMDGGTDRAEGEHNWGLVRNDGTPKPAYHALRALVGALASPAAIGRRGPRPAADRLECKLMGDTARLRVVPFLRWDGSVVVALWRSMRSWDPVAAADIVVPRTSVVITGLGGRFTAAGHAVWLDGGDAANEPAWSPQPFVDGRCELPVGDAVTLLRLNPGPH